MKYKQESQKNGCTTYDLTGGKANKNEIPALSVGIVGIQAGMILQKKIYPKQI